MSRRVQSTLWMAKLKRAGARMGKNDRVALLDWENVPHSIDEVVEACRLYETSATVEGPVIDGRLPKKKTKRRYGASGRILPTPVPGPGVAAFRYSGDVRVSIGKELLERDPFYTPSWRNEPAPSVLGYHVMVTTPWRGHATFIPWGPSDWNEFGQDRSFDEIARRAIKKVQFLGDAERGGDGQAIVSRKPPIIAD